MEKSERLSHNPLLKVFDELLKDRTALKIYLLGKGIDGLTVVTDIELNKQQKYFIIDYPGDNTEAFKKAVGEKVYLEFKGRDGLQYNFRSKIGKVTKEDIWVEFPDAIDRIQKRRHFRIVPSSGTKILCTAHETSFEFNVVNLSEGGALIKQSGTFHDEQLFNIGGYIRRLFIQCREDFANVRIEVNKSEIKRIEKNSETNLISYALQFLEFRHNEKDRLIDFIYRCQREILKRQSNLADKL
jgi:c-di-GMP-binding flagellar brake protein YcgR